MELELFSFIQDTIKYYNLHMGSYEYAMGQIRTAVEKLCEEDGERVVSYHCRIKEEKSLKEKLIRNRFYLDYRTGEEAIAHLSDLIGITIECRFIRNENEIYQNLIRHFTQYDDGYAVCNEDPRIFLNTRMPQPQYQRNGFTIYRMDGYFVFNNSHVNFELQIKSMVHNFWSDIEHEMVYKNPDFAVYDRFNKAMLGAIRDNLDIVDHQLEIMFDEISDQSSHRQIGMDEKGFKVFAAQSINELMNRKMVESFGFTTDFKKASATLAQYIYINDFLNGAHNREAMVDYLEHLNYLSETEIDLRQEIVMEHAYTDPDLFCSKIGQYWQSVMNQDFQWHTFFVMLFEIQPQSNDDDFNEFVHVIEKLLVQPSWFRKTFSDFTDLEQKRIRDDLLETLAEAMIQSEKIDMIHEDNLHKMMGVFRRYTEFLEQRYRKYEEYESEKDICMAMLKKQLSSILH